MNATIAETTARHGMLTTVLNAILGLNLFATMMIVGLSVGDALLSLMR